jgi:hypothetical protein
VLIGITILSIIMAQILLGFTSNIMKQVRKSPPLAQFVINKCHKYLGYILLILAKIQVFLHIGRYDEDRSTFDALLAVEVILFVLFVARKLLYPTMTKKIMPHFDDYALKKVQTLKEVNIA